MGPRHISINGKITNKPVALYDRWLLFSTVCIVAVGLLMVASSSIVISEQLYHHPFYFLGKQIFYFLLGLLCGFFVLRVDTRIWQKMSVYFLMFSAMLLVLVLIPGIGRSVNGSMRWIGFGLFGFQVSELAKLSVVIYLSGYLVRHQDEVRHKLSGFIKPMFILCLLAALLLKEPDFGAAVVIIATAMGMMFIAGVRMRHFIALLSIVAVAIAGLAISSPYRMQRLTSFLNPWANQFDSGYQLTQSLIAFGRGSWFGMGLGESVQKLFYLPEAHTDFLMAVLAEETGLLGTLVIIALYVLLVSRGMIIARRAQLMERYFAAYVAYGLSLWIGLQTMINMGVNSGLLPTKGLTLPLMSYGGSSMLVMCIVIALLMRIDHETRWEKLGFSDVQAKRREM